MKGPVTVEGVEYPSVRAAYRAIGDRCEVTLQGVYKRIRHGATVEEALLASTERGIPVTVEGIEYPTIQAALGAYGVSHGCYQGRIDKGWGYVEAITTPPSTGAWCKRGNPVTVDGVTYRSIKHATRAVSPVGYTTVCYRLSAGWPLVKALKTRSNRKKKKLDPA